MIRAMGHPADRIHLMQGSLADWESFGGPIETGPKDALKTDNLDYSRNVSYVSQDTSSTVNMEDVMNIVTKGTKDSDAVIVDARSSGRFRGEVPEPRPGVRGGHMPGSLNVPFTDLLDDENPSKFRPQIELKAVFDKAGVDIGTEKRIVCSCGSGVTACAVAIALEECGRNPSETFIYDGSWIEWGMDSQTPVVL